MSEAAAARVMAPQWRSTATYLILAGCVLFALPLVAHAYAGTFSRYFGDDYCAGYIYRDYGVLGGQKWFYMNWGAVPATVFLTAVTAPAGARLTPWLPAAAIFAWVAVMTWALRRVLACLGRPIDRARSLLLAEVIVFVAIADAPNVIQSVYVRIPLFEYVGPLIVLAGYIGFLARSWAPLGDGPAPLPARSPTLLASGVIMFVAGSLGPSYVAVQTTALAVAWLIAKVFRRDREARMLLAGLAGSLAALALVVVAPGNAERQSRYPQPPGLAAIIQWSFLSTLFVFARPLLPLLSTTIAGLAPAVFGSTPAWLPMALEMATSPLTLLLAIGVPAWLAFTGDDSRDTPSWRHLRLMLLGAPLLAFLLVMSCVAPSVYGTSAPPPPRTLIIATFVMASLAACWGYVAGLALRGRRAFAGRAVMAAVAVAMAALWSVSAATAHTIRQGRMLHEWSARWDEMDRRLRAAQARGERDVRLPLVEKVGGMESFGPSASDWVNYCAARYYGLGSVMPPVRP